MSMMPLPFSMTSVATDTIPLTWNEALSGIFGSISLACWIFVLVPQLYENYSNKSAIGLSLAFLGVWFIGDVTNFAGAALAGLVPTVIALSIWYLLADAVLIGQVMYYNFVNKWNQAASSAVGPDDDTEALPPADEQAPLLRRNSTDVPGSRRRSSASKRRGSTGLPTVEEERRAGRQRQTWKNVGAVIGLSVIGVIGWGIAYGTGAWKPTPARRSGDELNGGDGGTLAIVLGYASAVCYLGARVPQIIKNFREQSCEGLSLLFFVLSMMGNLTYGAQIVFHSVERRYLLTNLPWLLGSVGTIGEDMLIFVQFHWYSKDEATE